MKNNMLSKVSFTILAFVAAPAALLANPFNVPDSGSSAVLLTIGVAGLLVVLRFSAKAK